MNQWTKEEVFTSVIQSIPRGLKVQMENKKSKSGYKKLYGLLSRWKINISVLECYWRISNSFILCSKSRSIKLLYSIIHHTTVWVGGMGDMEIFFLNFGVSYQIPNSSLSCNFKLLLYKITPTWCSLCWMMRRLRLLSVIWKLHLNIEWRDRFRPMLCRLLTLFPFSS